MIHQIFGALGLFLIGMWLMTEGLKLAGGRALERLLGEWTSTRLRGLGSGILITAIVQSSSAVTVAIIGFVNAGLMQFRQAIWVVFGSNVGTTFTAWIVTWFGFNLDIGAFAYLMVGSGAAMRIFLPYDRGRALGMALAGFGLFFIGIGELRDCFSAYAGNVDVESFFQARHAQALFAVLIGVVLTVITQSSSAAITVILTAVASNVISLDVAAATVIGANIGTTSTALLASIGATPNAKRLAAAHIGFNIITAAVALLILPFFWWVVESIAELVDLENNKTMVLAIFHTLFNVMGVLLMWPLESHFSRRLLTLFEPKHTGTLRHLDNNSVAVPELAIRAILLELQIYLDRCSKLRLPTSQDATDERTVRQMQRDIAQILDFIGRALKSGLTERHSQRMADCLAVCHHLNYASENYLDALARLHKTSALYCESPAMLYDWFAEIDEYLNSYSPLDDNKVRDAAFHSSYEKTKAALFKTVDLPATDVESLDSALQCASLARRFVEQIRQALEIFVSLTAGKEAPTSS